MVAFGSTLGDDSQLAQAIFTGGLLLVAIGAALVAWEKWWRAKTPDPDREVIKQKAVALLNFCEEIASEYLDELLDREVADKNVAYIAASTWRQAEPFVRFLREETGEDRAWDRLEHFAKLWLLARAAPAKAAAPEAGAI